MKATLAARVNLVTQAEEVANFSCWSRKSRNILRQKPAKGTSQYLIKVIRENSCVSFLFFRINLQSNPSNTDTEGTERSVRIREVSV